MDAARSLLADKTVEPRNVWRLRQRLAVALMELDQHQAAVAELEAALESAPQDPVLHFNLGRALKRLERPGRAVAEYEYAVEMAPDRYPWRLEYAEVLLGLGIYRDAMRQISLARQICGDCPRALRVEINAYLGRGDPVASLEPLRRLFELEPQAAVRRLLAAALWAADEPAELTALLDTVAVARLTGPEMMLLIQSDRRLGRAERALSWIRDAQEPLADCWEPEPDFWAIASEVCLAAGYPIEALEAIDRALERSPRSALYHNNRAVVLLQLGRREAAEAALEEARRLAADPGPSR